MRFIADFHIHSKYARATSIDMDLEHLDYWAKVKGINVLGTGDFTHPLWFKELKEKLEEKKEGLFLLKNNKKETYFILTSEVSCVYSKKGKTRKIHLIIFAPSFEVVEKINTRLGWIGNLSADGRPTLGIDAKELTKIILDISDKCLIVPAHCWTPWFSLFGSKSGFDSIEECFEEYSQYIYAGETGLSANP
jgi:PHP family Zn ribbon phosphoesterase